MFQTLAESFEKVFRGRKMLARPAERKTFKEGVAHFIGKKRAPAFHRQIRKPPVELRISADKWKKALQAPIAKAFLGPAKHLFRMSSASHDETEKESMAAHERSVEEAQTGKPRDGRSYGTCFCRKSPATVQGLTQSRNTRPLCENHGAQAIWPPRCFKLFGRRDTGQ